MQGLSLAKLLHVYYIIRPNTASCKLQKKKKGTENTEKENKRQGVLL